MTQPGLFSQFESPPLAHKARPTQISDFMGQKHIFDRLGPIEKGKLSCLILYGPPGTGKTTLASILAKEVGLNFYPFNAVLGGVAELRKIVDTIQSLGNPAIIFIDEIHRFNKAQQDALLPHIEKGTFTLIGATTENPRVTLNKALLSRVKILKLEKLSNENLQSILEKANSKFSLAVPADLIQIIAQNTDGDARMALNLLEEVSQCSVSSTEELLSLVLERARAYDRGGDRHYDVISGFIKSLRGSDPDAAIQWLAVMLEGGEDPVFIARRLVIFASEDIGNSDPSALNLAVSGLNTVEKIGMPEARITLAQVTIYLACTTKSNSAYCAIESALEFVRMQKTLDVPGHLKNFNPSEKKAYQYPHDYPDGFVPQDYGAKKQFYFPKSIGVEAKLGQRLSNLWGNREFEQ